MTRSLLSLPPPQRGLRRYALFLGGATCLVLLLGGAVSTFALTQAIQQHEQASAGLGQLYRTEQLVFESDIAFKRQVQEWKDLLLRGREAVDFSHYRATFEQQNAQVEALLEALQSPASGLSEAEHQRAVELKSDHQKITARYLDALGPVLQLSPEQAFGIDRDLRGIDRGYSSTLEGFVKDVGSRIRELKAEQAVEEHRRYEELKTVIIAITALSLVLAVILPLALYPRQSR